MNTEEYPEWGFREFFDEETEITEPEVTPAKPDDDAKSKVIAANPNDGKKRTDSAVEAPPTKQTKSSAAEDGDDSETEEPTAEDVEDDLDEDDFAAAKKSMCPEDFEADWQFVGHYELMSEADPSAGMRELPSVNLPQPGETARAALRRRASQLQDFLKEIPEKKPSNEQIARVMEILQVGREKAEYAVNFVYRFGWFSARTSVEIIMLILDRWQTKEVWEPRRKED